MDQKTQAAILYDAQKKNLVVAYLLWAIGMIGIFGLHRFYMGRPNGGWMLAAGLVGAVLAFGGVGFLLLLPLAIIWIIDAIRMPGWTRDYNLALAQSLTG
jgi:TM2 domain-containing membrane protein YozV